MATRCLSACLAGEATTSDSNSSIGLRRPHRPHLRSARRCMPGRTISLVRTLSGTLARSRVPQPFAGQIAARYQDARHCSTGAHSLAFGNTQQTTASVSSKLAVDESNPVSTATGTKARIVHRDNDSTMPDRSWTAARVAPTPAELLSTNQKWLADADPEMFASTAKGQKPSIFWLGCCDSRVPAELITGAAPGDLFVHRNIANTFSSKDGSALAALAYAVNHLGVTDIIVCGHQMCGGVQAALASAKDRQAATEATDEGSEAISNWLSPIRALAVANLRTSSSFAAETDQSKAMRTLVEQNVCAQVSNVASCPVVKKAWRAGKDLTVHGWVYDISTGKIEDLRVSEGTNVNGNPLS